MNDIVHTSVSAQAGWGLGTPSPLPNGHVRGNLAMQIAAELSMGSWGGQPNAHKQTAWYSLYSCRERYRSRVALWSLCSRRAQCAALPMWALTHAIIMYGMDSPLNYSLQRLGGMDRRDGCLTAFIFIFDNLCAHPPVHTPRGRPSVA